MNSSHLVRAVHCASFILSWNCCWYSTWCNNRDDADVLIVAYRHLNDVHVPSERSMAQLHVQMEIIGQLEAQVCLLRPYDTACCMRIANGFCFCCFEIFYVVRMYCFTSSVFLVMAGLLEDETSRILAR